MSLLVIYNPACGDCTAEQFFNTQVIPRLHSANRIPTEIICTCSPGDAGVKTLSFINGHKGDVTVVLGSGDGTLHEIVNHLAFATDDGIHEKDTFHGAIRFVLVPCGTANALYASLFRPHPTQGTVAYKLRSLEAFLGSSTSRPLTLSLTSLLGPPGSHRDSRLVASIVVTSTALHAVILRDSEKLRGEIPGIERFKVAAQQNITKWYAGSVKLLPDPSSGIVRIYDPGSGDFVPFWGSDDSDSASVMRGPFAYFLSTVNVDRLEPEFRINPMISQRPPTSTSTDVIMLRPHRDPIFKLDTPQARDEFAQKTIAIFTMAYQDGIHINARYSENGDITETGDGDTVIECFRCGGWEWIPDETDRDAHLLCADGVIFEIEKGGRATCRATASRADTNLGDIYVHV